MKSIHGPVRHIRSTVFLTVAAIALLAGGGSASAFSESPELKAKVDDGTLPSVDQRLPEAPAVIEPYTRVGEYGGVIRSAINGDGDYNSILRSVGVQGLMRWTLDFSDVVPNVAESVTHNDDYSEFTFALRKGMKWSDGEPFGADDLMFFFEDLLPNKEFFQTPPSLYSVDGKLVTATKIDDSTVKVAFAAPYRSFLEALASPPGQGPVLYAKHYCQQFHPKYAENIDALMRQNNAADWAALMRMKCADIELPARWASTERPTIDPWVITEPYTGSATRVVLSRNPYYWQVDTAGNQLPYTDALQFSVMNGMETVLLAAFNGQIDLQTRLIDPISNLPVLSQNAEKGGYTIMRLQGTNANAAGLQINQTTQNVPLRKLIATPGFSKALSLGIDREEINEIVFFGQGQPGQIGPLPGTKFYNEQLGTQFIAHEPEEANNILDELGLTKRDAQGFRVFPENGQRITMYAIASLAKPWLIEVLELVRQQWEDIGINLSIQSSERSLFYDRAQNNDYDISVDAIVGGLDATQDMRAILAVHPLDSRQSIPWVKWYQSGGTQGEEPSENMKQRLELLQQWSIEPDQEKADAIFREILVLAADAFEVIGTVLPPPMLGIRNSKLLNVFDEMPSGWSYATPGGSLPQQYFFEK